MRSASSARQASRKPNEGGAEEASEWQFYSQARRAKTYTDARLKMKLFVPVTKESQNHRITE